MTVSYYLSAAQILNDSLYTAYGGRTGTSTPSQRLAAYQIAEQQMIEHIGTFLLPTTVTGTFEFRNDLPSRYQLPHERVMSVDAVSILSRESCCDCDLSDDPGCANIVDAEYGFIDVKAMHDCLSSCGNWLSPYQVEIAYTAGFPTGVAAHDSGLHLALMIVAEINLLEMMDPAANEGGPGDPGVNEFVSMGYAEKRVFLSKTRLGNSARANKAAQLVEHLRKKKAMKLGW